MAHDFETPSTHEPALSRQHAAGPGQDRLSPAERALAPESRVPLQSPCGVADDGAYVGRCGGYAGSREPAAARETRGEGTYGYPAGPGVGVPGGEHQPEGLPDPYAPGLEDLLPPEPDAVARERRKSPQRARG